MASQSTGRDKSSGTKVRELQPARIIMVCPSQQAIAGVAGRLAIIAVGITPGSKSDDHTFKARVYDDNSQQLQIIFQTSQMAVCT